MQCIINVWVISVQVATEPIWAGGHEKWVCISPFLLTLIGPAYAYFSESILPAGGLIGPSIKISEFLTRPNYRRRIWVYWCPRVWSGVDFVLFYINTPQSGVIFHRNGQLNPPPPGKIRVKPSKAVERGGGRIALTPYIIIHLHITTISLSYR